MVLRILGWGLLILGIGLAGLGGARNGPRMVALEQAKLPVETLDSDLAALDAAYISVSDALHELRLLERASASEDRVNAARATADEAEQSVLLALHAIEEHEARGLWSGNRAAARAQLAAAVPSTPPPLDRLLDWLLAGGLLWGAGVIFVGVGAFLARASARQESRAPSAGAGRVDFPGTLVAIRDALDGVASQIEDLPMDAESAAVRAELDRIQDDLITPVVEGRDQLTARHGTAGFAVYFGSFSAGERNLARVWSALTDGHAVVAREALQRSQASFAAAAEEWDEAEAG